MGEAAGLAESQGEDRDNAEMRKGGIDLNTDKLNLKIKGDGSAAVNAIDPAMLEQLQAAPGFIPVILNISPAGDLPAFFGITRGAMPALVASS